MTHGRSPLGSLALKALATAALAVALLAPAGAVAGAAGSSGGHTAPRPSIVSGANWPAYLNGPQHSSYNAGATAITPGNVGTLQPAWQWLVPNDPNHNKLFASPIVMNGVVYAASYNGWLYAVSEADRHIIWQIFLGTIKGQGVNGCGTGVTGIIATPTVTTDPGTGKLAVYENAPDGHLYAIDAATGAVLWTGVVGIPSTTVNDYFAWGSPLVANGKVYVGISSQCDNPLVQGGLLAFNQDSASSTNTPAATFHTLPDSVMCQPPQTTPGCGGSIWSSPAQAGDGSIIVTTGNGPPTASSGVNNPPNAASMVKLDPNTLAVEHAFTIPLNEQTNDSDWGGSPTIFTATLNGISTPMVGGCNKDGHYYGLRQSDLSMVWDYVMGTPSQPGGAQQCDAAALWDGTHLIAGGGSPTTINGTQYPGSVQSLYPATGSVDGTTTGHPVWQTGLPGNIVGSPTEDGAGVVAAPVYLSSTGQQGVYLLSATTGAILGFVPTPGSVLFGQPVWAGNDLLIGAGTTQGLTAYEATATPGPTVTGVNPPTVVAGQSTPLTVSGTGFQAGLSVSSTAPGATFAAPTGLTSTSLTTSVTVPASTGAGAYNLIVTNPGGAEGICAGCLTVTTPPPPPPINSPAGPLGAPVTGMASLPDGSGYWLVNSHGVVSPHGGAVLYGDLSATALNAPVNHIVATPDGKGYWLVAADGGVFTFGDAGFFGSTGNKVLNAPVVDIAPTPTGKGYWLVASDGGVFTFGDAAFHGSMGGKPLNRPVVGIAADRATGGYWLVATDGGIFSFGAPFFGSTGSKVLNQPVNGMAVTADAGGYWFVASDGGIFSFGDAAFHGSTGGTPLNAPVVGMAANNTTGGYWLVASDGGVFSFGTPFYGAD